MCFADMANVDNSGKLNIVGVVRRIYAGEVPAQIHRLAAVVSLALTEEEKLSNEPTKVELYAPSEKLLVQHIFSPADIKFGSLDDVVQMVFGLDGNTLEEFGTYRLVATFNNDVVGEASVIVQHPVEGVS